MDHLIDHSLFTAKDENVEKARKEIDYLSKDFTKLGQIIEIASSLRFVITFSSRS